MSDFDMIRALKQNDARLRLTEVKEVPGGIPGFTSFYDSGTWTPAIVGATIAGTFTYAATRGGTYTRIGDTVFVRGRIAFSAITVAPTGSLKIEGLPFNGSPSIAVAGGVQFTYWSAVGIGGGATVYLAGAIANATTAISLFVSSSNGSAAVALTGATAALTTNSDLIFQGQYQV